MRAATSYLQTRELIDILLDGAIVVIALTFMFIHLLQPTANEVRTPQSQDMVVASIPTLKMSQHKTFQEEQPLPVPEQPVASASAASGGAHVSEVSSPTTSTSQGTVVHTVASASSSPSSSPPRAIRQQPHQPLRTGVTHLAKLTKMITQRL